MLKYYSIFIIVFIFFKFLEIFLNYLLFLEKIIKRYLVNYIFFRYIRKFYLIFFVLVMVF